LDELALLLQEHYVNYPKMDVQDAVKFLYQNSMGPGHMIASETDPLARLESEWDNLTADTSSPLTEYVGNDLYRLDLRHCKAIGLSTKTVNRIFFLTARNVVADPKGLQKKLDLIRKLPFPADSIDRYLEQYRADGCPMVSHSPRYRAAYRPAYRIVSGRYVNLLPVLAAIDCRLKRGKPLRVALDGPCASGKSTIGRLLADIYHAPLIHMDDFFLRPEQRTPERLAQPGGNVDYERFWTDVLSPLVSGSCASYRPWQCHTGRFGPEIRIEPAAVTVTEGCYSLRPEFQGLYQLKVWVEAPWPVRQERILKRDGPDALQRFQSLWIPLEDAYFRAFDVAACCDIRLDMV